MRVARLSLTKGFSSVQNRPKIVVFGGNGYIGQHVCEASVEKFECEVVSISRTGCLNNPSVPRWSSNVLWTKGDIFDGSTYRKHLEGATGVVCCVGAFGSDVFMEKMNGDGPINAVREAKDAGVKNFVFISTVDSNLPDFVLKGYFNGKRRAEKEVLHNFPEGGVVLRPSFVYGTRYQGSVGIPLWLLGQPMEKLFSMQPFSMLANNVPGMKAILAPPISVSIVALNASKGAIGKLSPGIYSATDMNLNANMY